MESALRRMDQDNMDLGTFQYMKVYGDIYTQGSDGYSVIATDMSICHWYGVALFYRNSP